MIANANNIEHVWHNRRGDSLNALSKAKTDYDY